MPDPIAPQLPEPTAAGERTLKRPINTGRIALYFVLGICGIIVINNLTHLRPSSASADTPKRSAQPTKPAVTDPQNIDGFIQQEAQQVAKLKKEADELMKSTGATTANALPPCDPSLAGTRTTAPNGAPLMCGSDSAWHPAPAQPAAPAAAGSAPALTPAQEEAQRKKAALERRTELALASTTVAVDFTATDDHKATSDAGSDRNTQSYDRNASDETAAAAPKPIILNPAPTPAANGTANAALTTSAPANPRRDSWFRYSGPLHRIFEGTILETVLTNRINGSFAGPINTMVTTNLYSHDHQTLLIPQGTRCLGSVSAVGSTQQQRLFVAFHRCIMPDGYPIDLDKFTGLNQIGETALRDLVNHHYVQIFGVSLAIGAIGGLAQIGNSSTALAYDPAVSIRNGISQQTAQESLQILDRFLNQLPTFVVREKTRVKIYFSQDLEVPAFDDHIIDPAI